MTVALAAFREALRAALEEALAALRPTELERPPFQQYSPAVLMGAPPVEGRALRRLDRAEQITAAGA